MKTFTALVEATRYDGHKEMMRVTRVVFPPCGSVAPDGVTVCKLQEAHSWHEGRIGGKVWEWRMKSSGMVFRLQTEPKRWIKEAA